MTAASFPEIPLRSIPCVDAAQMREVDSLMTVVYGIHLLQMMELAGFHTAGLVRTLFTDVASGERMVVVCCGAGGNGGGGMSCARHLHNAGVTVSLVLSRTHDSFTGVPARQLATLKKLGVSHLEPPSRPQDDEARTVWVDALIGYSLKGEPAGEESELIRFLNTVDGPVVSLDVPSGLDASEGPVNRHTVRSDATLTLALPKRGFLCPNSETFVGDLYLADIGVPPALYREPSLNILIDETLFPAPVVRCV